ncbi:hypothetical protein BOTCAL_0036g00280 [Botryotinia calthae]|uniref:Uncharacterized protein n=1 Tax=Botryotinia calthae TaxID=38488 RepID=A0A4Y8DD73_9HELO|nr:hypothetical protein BOTCAL_0036g00280 [Botryotinia calthae]
MKDQTDQITLAADRLKNAQALFHALSTALSYYRPHLRGGLSTVVRVLFHIILIHHPPDLCQCIMPTLPLNITDCELPAVSPLQSEPQLECDRCTTNHGLQKAPKRLRVLKQQENKRYETLLIISLPLVQKISRFLTLFTVGKILVNTSDEIHSVALQVTARKCCGLCTTKETALKWTLVYPGQLTFTVHSVKSRSQVFRLEAFIKVMGL